MVIDRGAGGRHSMAEAAGMIFLAYPQQCFLPGDRSGRKFDDASII
jgi:hypothetical protein